MDLKTPPVTSGNLRPFAQDSPADWGVDGLTRELSAGTPHWTINDWERELEDEAAIGFNLLWLSHAPPALESGALGGLLDLCARRGVGVILATDYTPDWFDTLDTGRELEVAGRFVNQVTARHGGHPALFAWYVPHEIYAAWGAFAQYMDELYPRLTELCKKAAPGVPVALSPFFILDRERIFGDYQYAEPDEYREYWTRLIRRGGFDIIMLQDSGEHFSYVTNEQRRPFFAAMGEACRAAGARLWGNVELAEYVCPSIEEFVSRYGRVHHSTVRELPWHAVPMGRLESKLRLAAQFSERIVSWGYYQYGRPHLSPAAAQWYLEYRAYYQKVAVAPKTSLTGKISNG